MKKSTMQALVRESLEEKSMFLRELPIPNPNTREALIQVQAVGICGTDLHIYNGHTDTNVPLIIGHEFSGIVKEVGADVTSVKPGNHVISRLNLGSCGICRACLTGNPQMCTHRTCPGFKLDGAYAEYIKMDASMLIPIPDQIPFEEAALTEPMAIVTHALLERTKVEPEDQVVVIGPGAIGLLAMQMAKRSGASKVAVIGTDADLDLRLPLAKKLGADLVLNSQKDHVAEALLDFTNGKKVDLVVEASGAVPAINLGLQCLRPQGRMCVLGLPGKRTSEIEWLTAAEKSLQIIFSYSSSPWSWNVAASMLERKAIQVKPIITQIVPMKDYQKAFEDLAAGKSVKSVLIP